MAAYLVKPSEDGTVSPAHDGVNFYIIFANDGAEALDLVLADLESRGIPTGPWAAGSVNPAGDILLMRGTAIDPDNIQFD